MLIEVRWNNILKDVFITSFGLGYIGTYLLFKRDGIEILLETIKHIENI